KQAADLLALGVQLFLKNLEGLEFARELLDFELSRFDLALLGLEIRVVAVVKLLPLPTVPPDHHDKQNRHREPGHVVLDALFHWARLSRDNLNRVTSSPVSSLVCTLDLRVASLKKTDSFRDFINSETGLKSKASPRRLTFSGSILRSDSQISLGMVDERT